MPVKAQDSGIVQIEPKKVAVIAVHVLEKLGYRVSRHSKEVDEIVANLQLNEQVGRDWFRSDYQVVLEYLQGKTGCVVNVEVTEKTGGATTSECAKRAEEIIVKLQHDAERAKEREAKREKSTLYGSARWGTEEDLRQAGYLVRKPPATQLIAGRTSGGDYISVPERLTYSHALVVGRTGVGKTTGFFIPNIIERLGVNMIITEATPDYGPGEIFSLSSGWRQQAGHEVFYFNPAMMSSTRINPIDRVRKAPEEKKASEAERLADLLIANAERPGTRTDPAFDRSEKALLVSLVLYCASADEKYGHFGALRWLLLSGLRNLGRLMKESPSRLARLEYQGWRRDQSEGFLYSVVAGLKTKLNPWMTDQIVALTEKTDFDFDALRDKLWTFYISVPSRSRDSQLLGSLVVNFLLDLILDERSRSKYRTAVMMDEFTNFGKIANIGHFLSIVRKAKVGLVLGFQNYYQLESVYDYKEAKIIFDQPATQIFFQQKKFQEAKQLSEALGRITVEETDVDHSGRISQKVMGRELATPDELMRLHGHALVLFDEVPPCKLQLTKPDAYEMALQYPPPDRPDHPITEFIRNRGDLFEDDEAEDGDGGRERRTERDGGRQKQTDRKKYRERKREREPDTARKDTREEPASKPDMGDVWE